MPAAVTQAKSVPKTAASAKKTLSGPISWADFERKYLPRENRYKYEWVDGEVVRTLRTMNQEQQFIWLNLKNFLETLRAQGQNLGELIPEVDTFFTETRHRRPDIAYFSPEQIAVFRHTNQVPQFIAEITSNHDQLNKAHQKLADYRQAGVPVVWQVFPKTGVHVYRGKNMTICTGDDPCSAEPVIPGFVLPAAGVFQ